MTTSAVDESPVPTSQVQWKGEESISRSSSCSRFLIKQNEDLFRNDTYTGLCEGQIHTGLLCLIMQYCHTRSISQFKVSKWNCAECGHPPENELSAPEQNEYSLPY